MGRGGEGGRGEGKKEGRRRGGEGGVEEEWDHPAPSWIFSPRSKSGLIIFASPPTPHPILSTISTPPPVPPPHQPTISTLA
jgi:hypothetical protein